MLPSRLRLTDVSHVVNDARGDTVKLSAVSGREAGTTVALLLDGCPVYRLVLKPDVVCHDLDESRWIIHFPWLLDE